MPYNSLATVNPGDVLSSSAWGNVVKANEDYLFSGRPKQVIVLDHNANYSTTSTSFVDIDSSNLVITLTVNSGNVLIAFVGTFFGTGVGLTWNLDFLIDGTRYASTGASGLQAADFGSSPNKSPQGLVVPMTGLSVGSHTFKPQWKTSANTLGLYAGAGSNPTDMLPVFYVMEVG